MYALHIGNWVTHWATLYVENITVRCSLIWQNIFYSNDTVFSAPTIQTVHWTVVTESGQYSVFFVSHLPAGIHWPDRAVHAMLLCLSDRCVRDRIWKPSGPAHTSLTQNVLNNNNNGHLYCARSLAKYKAQSIKQKVQKTHTMDTIKTKQTWHAEFTGWRRYPR